MVTKRLDESVRRRLRAGRMLLAGKTPAQAAHAVGVARQTVYTWKALLDEGGIDALRAMPTRGRPARLDDEQLQALGRALPQRPTEHGVGTELWTLKRVGVLIERLYGVKLGRTQIWRILGGLGFYLQKHERSRHRARRRCRANVEAQELARAQKKAQREGRLIVFIDESGLSERPTRVRT